MHFISRLWICSLLPERFVNHSFTTCTSHTGRARPFTGPISLRVLDTDTKPGTFSTSRKFGKSGLKFGVPLCFASVSHNFVLTETFLGYKIFYVGHIEDGLCME